jgi:hypothetical protein
MGPPLAAELRVRIGPAGRAAETKSAAAAAAVARRRDSELRTESDTGGPRSRLGPAAAIRVPPVGLGAGRPSS